ncbi:unnamed protein product [Parnassius apollo]|uniref:(apollo) hypothetical protein n=1 Tax=Parnassius apollo TaxID=110799 RepID=A0A8S3WXQ0_PARAO|nr:unnamed protein product [Parnassius apollo]
MTVLSKPIAGSSHATVPSTVSVLPPASPTSSESSVADAEPRAPGSSGGRVHYYAEEIRSHWNMYKIITRLNTPAQCIAFDEEHRLLPTEKMCSYHKWRPMALSSSSKTGQLGILRCRKSNCRSKAVSRAAGTWFENARLSIKLQFLLMYMFSQKYSYLQVKLETAPEDKETILSTRTITDEFFAERQ